MILEEIEEKLKKELKERGLELVWKPQLDQLRSTDMIVFGAEQIPGQGRPLTAGFGCCNSDLSDIDSYRAKFLDALKAVGIPRSSIKSEFPHVGRGKIWPTFVARLTQKEFRELRAIPDKKDLSDHKKT